MPERFDPAILADAGRCRIAERVLLVAAHPDDETVGLGAQLVRCEDLILLHLTDGAPRDLADARRHGFADAVSYAAARARELRAGLAAGEVSCRRFSYGLPDQGLVRQLSSLALRLSALVRELWPAALITHAYEGGHPDHDSAALACQIAVESLPAARRPVRLEFVGYHAAEGALRWGAFSGGGEEVIIGLSPDEQRRKAAMLACFETQAAVLAPLPRIVERLRRAPLYDFTTPPHPGALWYERMGWGVDGARWRDAARDALDACAAEPAC
jgi:N-acetylglucosamine malate deacetylase 2